MGKKAVSPVLSLRVQSSLSFTGNLQKSHTYGQDSADSPKPGRDVTPLNLHDLRLPDLHTSMW